MKALLLLLALAQTDWTIDNPPAPSMPYDSRFSGRIATPLVDGERVWILEPEGTPIAAANSITPAAVTIRDLNTGKELTRYTSPIARSTVQRSNAGSMDTDLVHGVFWNFSINGSIIAASGGDSPGRAVFDRETGLPITIPLGTTVIGSGVNVATAFTSHAKVPFVISGGNNNHSHLSANGSIHDLRGSGKAYPWVGYKQWNVGLIHEGTQAAYRLDAMERTSPTTPGTRVWGLSATHGGVGCEIPGERIINAYGNDGNGYPKPATVMDDGTIIILTQNAVGDVSLIGIGHIPPNKKDLGLIPGFTSWYKLPVVFRVPVPMPANRYVNHAKITPAGSKVVILFGSAMSDPQTLACVDTAEKKVLWNWRLPDEITQYVFTYLGDNFPRHNNIALIANGENVVIGEHVPGALKLHRFALASGVYHGVKSVAIDSAACDERYHTVQSLQATTKGVLFSTIHRKAGKTHQSYGLASLEAIEPQPTPVKSPEQEVLEFAKPRLTAEKYSAVEAVLKP